MHLKNIARYILKLVIPVLMIPAATTAAVFSRPLRTFRKQPRLLWGVDPLINHKYHAAALKADYVSTSCVIGVFSINKANDFDIILSLKNLPKFLFYALYTLIKYDIFHLSFNGGLYSELGMKWIEPWLYRIAGIKVIVIAFGADVALYENISNKGYAHTLMSTYPQTYQNNLRVKQQIARWSNHANIIIPSMFAAFNLPRWDIVTPNILCIDMIDSPEFTRQKKKPGDPIFVVHSPNHRLIKGTEYIVQAVSELKSEGLNLELILLEKLPNDEVLDILKNKADILVEKLIGPSYALSGIEGMSMGIPVISNINSIDWKREMKLFYRYSYLGECPILTANPESIKEKLKLLYHHADLREQLGKAGKQYARKYHSYDSVAQLFNMIYKKIWHNQPTEIMNYYHPITGKGIKYMPKVEHPLTENNYDPS